MFDAAAGFRAIHQSKLFPKRLFEERLRALRIGNEKFSYALMPAKDDQRVQAISKLLDLKTELFSKTGERLYKGKIAGVKVLVLNSGVGGPSTALTIETLLHVGVHSFIRVGSAGAIQPHLKTGDVVLPTGAVRGEGTSAEYVWAAYPAFADPSLHASLAKTCEQLGKRLALKWYPGITWTHDAFFAENAEKLREMRQANVLAVDMEVATLFTLASLRGVRAAAILAVTDNMVEGRARRSVYTDPGRRKRYLMGSNAIAQIAVDAVKLDQRSYRLLKSSR